MSKTIDETQQRMPSWRKAFLYFLFPGFVSVGDPQTRFLAGVSAAVVGVIAVVSLELNPEAILVGLVSGLSGCVCSYRVVEGGCCVCRDWSDRGRSLLLLEIYLID